MYYNGHLPPHFHAMHGDDRDADSVQTRRGLSGALPRTVLKKLCWGRAASHRRRSATTIGNGPREVASRCSRSRRCPEAEYPRHDHAANQAGGAVDRASPRLLLTDGTTVERDVSHLLTGPVFEAIRARPVSSSPRFAWNGEAPFSALNGKDVAAVRNIEETNPARGSAQNIRAFGRLLKSGRSLFSGVDDRSPPVRLPPGFLKRLRPTSRPPGGESQRPVLGDERRVGDLAITTNAGTLSLRVAERDRSAGTCVRPCRLLRIATERR